MSGTRVIAGGHAARLFAAVRSFLDDLTDEVSVRGSSRFLDLDLDDLVSDVVHDQASRNSLIDHACLLSLTSHIMGMEQRCRNEAQERCDRVAGSRPRLWSFAGAPLPAPLDLFQGMASLSHCETLGA